MQARLRLHFIILICAVGGFQATPVEAWQAVATPAPDVRLQQRPTATTTEQIPEETPEGEVSPAAVTLDLSNASPLIQVLYDATRETKPDRIVARIEEAKKLVEQGADVKAADRDGRTALHWAVFGSSFSTNQKVIVAYEEIAHALIAKGVDVNREDAYQNTALDYLLYSPEFEMQTLLLENRATSGFLAMLNPVLSDCGTEPGPPARQEGPQFRSMDLKAGATLSIRLDGPVYSDRSRIGDPVEATVTYPLCKDGEQVECKPGELLVAPGTKIDGTILFAEKAPSKYARPRLVIDFSSIVHRDGTRSPLYARVLSVDNARETVRNNEVLGIVQPHASRKLSLAVSAVSAVNPIASYTIRGVQTVYGLSLRREILFPAGSDMQVQVVRPSQLKEKEPWAGWPTLPPDAKLKHLVETAPLRTATPKNIPSDVTNLLFIGTERQLTAAFAEAGWMDANNLSVRSALKVAQATLRQSGYAEGPVSSLLLEGRPPDFVFQKSLNTFAKRHHIRIWRMKGQFNGRDLWIGAATHDIATMNSRAGTKWSHRIDPHVDRERDWVLTDLLFTGTAAAYIDIDRPTAPRRTRNATGDNILTDGKVSVVELGSAAQR